MYCPGLMKKTMQQFNRLLWQICMMMMIMMIMMVRSESTKCQNSVLQQWERQGTIWRVYKRLQEYNWSSMGKCAICTGWIDRLWCGTIKQFRTEITWELWRILKSFARIASSFALALDFLDEVVDIDFASAFLIILIWFIAHLNDLNIPVDKNRTERYIAEHFGQTKHYDFYAASAQPDENVPFVSNTTIPRQQSPSRWGCRHRLCICISHYLDLIHSTFNSFSPNTLSVSLLIMPQHHLW
jgi:hypothetical protein